jgi:L-fuculose-phosphate aldolase
MKKQIWKNMEAKSKYFAELAYMAKSLEKYVVGVEGNLSARTEDGFCIKASGKSFQDIKNLDGLSISFCDTRGTCVGGSKPSMEVEFHTLLYKLNPNINFIAHTHPINCLKILVCKEDTDKFANERYFPDQVIFNGVKSCVVPYAKPGKMLAQEISYATKESGFVVPEVFLLRNHGIICCGKTAKQCVIATEICEKAAACFSRTATPLTKKEIEELINDKEEQFRKNLI